MTQQQRYVRVHFRKSFHMWSIRKKESLVNMSMLPFRRDDDHKLESHQNDDTPPKTNMSPKKGLFQ